MPEQKPALPHWLLRLLKLRVWLGELVRPNELQITLVWAGVIGFVGALSSVAFRKLTQEVHLLLTHQEAGYVETFAHLAWWQCLLIPTVGGVLAGLTLMLGKRIYSGKSSTDYMEAVVLGNGLISARMSLVKSVSAMFSIASGASIGREGPMVQLSSMLASFIGRVGKMPTVRLRLLVACGAAAGIASAYNAPIGGALFVSEIVLQSMSMESFGPLVFASVISTLTVRQFLGSDPLYEISVPVVRVNSNWEMILYVLLGVTTGVVAPFFQWSLKRSEKLFAKLPGPSFLRLATGGLIVGALAIRHPEVCGNGYTVLNGVLHGDYIWQTLILILAFKLVATAATFGSGAVGGVFTPTLFVGACVGYLFEHAFRHVWLGPELVPSAFTLVGMGALIAATNHAPIMAIIMLFEMTLDYQMIMPLMLACVVSHYVSLAFQPKSIYAESLKRKGGDTLRNQLSTLRVADLMKRNPVTVREGAQFKEIAESFIRNRFNYLYVVNGSNSYLGAVSMHDIKGYLTNRELATLVIARDLLRETIPVLTPKATLSQALERFSHHDGDRLPVVENREQRLLIGSISKTDLILALAEQNKQEETPQAGSKEATLEPTG